MLKSVAAILLSFTVLSEPVAAKTSVVDQRELAKLAFESENWDRARELLSPQAKAGDLDARYMLAIIDLGDGPKSQEKAVANLTNLAERGHIDALKTLAELYDLGPKGIPADPDRATRLLKQASDLGDAEATYLLGARHLALGQEHEALTFLNKAAEMKSPQAYVALGNIHYGHYLKSKKPDDQRHAEMWYGKGVSAGDIEAMNTLAWMWVEADVNLEDALSLAGTAARSVAQGAYLDTLGWTLFKLGRAEESTQALMLASELAPNDWMVFNHLGDALSEIDRPAEAKAAWEQAVSLLKATNDSAEAQKIERKAKKKGGFSI